MKGKTQKWEQVPITGELSQLDQMYDLFTEKFKISNLFNFSPSDKVYLHAQGGIDAINVALLLKLLEVKPDVLHLHKPEHSEISYPIKFPQKFLRNSRRQKIEIALKSYRYDIVASEALQEEVKLLAEYAKSRLALNISDAKQATYKLMESDSNPATIDEYFCRKLREEIESMDSKSLEKELFIAAMIKLLRREYADYLARIFTINDNILVPYIEEELGGRVVYSVENKHQEWLDLVGKKPDLVNYLDSILTRAGDRLNWKYPNKSAYKAIFDFYYTNEQTGENSLKKLKPVYMDDLLKRILNLSDLRNGIMHNYKGVNLEDIEKAVGGADKLALFHEQLYEHVGIEKGSFGIYDEINAHIFKILSWFRLPRAPVQAGLFGPLEIEQNRVVDFEFNLILSQFSPVGVLPR